MKFWALAREFRGSKWPPFDRGGVSPAGSQGARSEWLQAGRRMRFIGQITVP